jgi:hypothetical protein
VGRERKKEVRKNVDFLFLAAHMITDDTNPSVHVSKESTKHHNIETKQDSYTDNASIIKQARQ